MGIIFDNPNFEFLKDKPEFSDFAQECIDAENTFQKSPNACVGACRAALEVAVKWTYARDNRFKIDAEFKHAKDKHGNPVGILFKMIESKQFSRAVGKELLKSLHYVRKLGNKSLHRSPEDFNWKAKPQEALACLMGLFNFVQWIDRHYGTDYKSRTFNPKEVPIEPSKFMKILKDLGIAGLGALALIAAALLSGDDNKR